MKDTYPLGRQMQRPMYQRLMVLGAGLIYPLAFAPTHYWPLALASIALAWLALSGASAREALLRGWLYGVALFGSGISWVYISMHDYGFTPLWLAIPMTAAFAAALALFPALLFYLVSARASRMAGAPLVFSGLWVLLDVLRGWLLTGFPWLYAGYAMTDTWLAGLAPLGGVWLVTLATVTTGTALGQLAHNWRGAIPVTLIALLLWTLSAGENFYNRTQVSGDPISVALVQGNIPQDLRWQIQMRPVTRQIYADLTSSIPQNHLIIWPEAAIPEFYQDVYPFLEAQGTAVADRQGALITGIPWRTDSAGGHRYHNTVLVAAGGQGVYHKQRLVPFGEYVPLQSLLRGLIPFFDLPMSSFTAGTAQQALLEAKDIRIAPFICYEIVYPELVAHQSRNSHLLLTISNDAWFGTSVGPHQHFDMARLRARETGRWLIRATNNGITGIIDPRGKVTARLPQFERDVLYGQIEPVMGDTLYMQLGGWPVWLMSLLFTLGIFRHRKHTGA